MTTTSTTTCGSGSRTSSGPSWRTRTRRRRRRVLSGGARRRDLVDALVDALTNLADQGFIVLLTPKAGPHGQSTPVTSRRPPDGRPDATGPSTPADWAAPASSPPRPPAADGWHTGPMTKPACRRSCDRPGLHPRGPDGATSACRFRGHKSGLVVFYPSRSRASAPASCARSATSSRPSRTTTSRSSPSRATSMYTLRAWADARGPLLPAPVGLLAARRGGATLRRPRRRGRRGRAARDVPGRPGRASCAGPRSTPGRGAGLHAATDAALSQRDAVG